VKGSSGRSESRLYRAAMYLLLAAGALPILLPLYWAVLASLKSRERSNVSPPDWLPLEVRSVITIAGQEIPVMVFDDGSASRTGVCRVKMKREAAGGLRLPRSQLEAVSVLEHVATIDGREHRVQVPSDETDARAGDTVTAVIAGMRQQLVAPARNVETVEHESIYWLVLGDELPVKPLASDENPVDGWRTIVWEQPGPAIAVAPELYRGVGNGEQGAGNGEEATGKSAITVGPEPYQPDRVGAVRWAGRMLAARLVESVTPAGYVTIQLVCPPEGLRVPDAELRHERRVEEYVVSGEARHRVRTLERRPDGTVLVELVDLPQRARVPRERLRARERVVYYASILGQRREVEPIQSASAESSDAEVVVYVPGSIAVAADRIRTTRQVRPQWGNFRDAWREQNFSLYVANTLLIAALVVLGTILSCGLVGYAFARLEFRGRDLLFLILLSTMMIPGQVTSIPQFVLFVKLGWIDTYKPLILPHFLAGSAFFVFLFRQFMLTIPSDLEDAARIDGCGPLATWWLVMMPMSKPIIVTVGVFSFTYVWNDFLAPLLYINSDEKQTVALGLQNFKSAFAGFDPQLLMAASVMMILPTVLLFLLAQKAFIRGVVVSGVKG